MAGLIIVGSKGKRVSAPMTSKRRLSYAWSKNRPIPKEVGAKSQRMRMRRKIEPLPEKKGPEREVQKKKRKTPGKSDVANKDASRQRQSDK